MELRLFDLGGTLVDSAWSKKEAFVSFAARKGLDMPEDEIRRRLAAFPVARVRTSALMAWLGELGGPEPADGDRELFRRLEQSLEMRLVPGACAYLEALRGAGVQVGLVTNAGSSWLSNTLSNTPLGAFFYQGNIFGREEGEPKKPAPTAYRKAYARFSPSVCVAYEDTPRGILAARAGGVDMVIGLASSPHHQTQELIEVGADVVYPSYLEIPVHPLRGLSADGAR